MRARGQMTVDRGWKIWYYFQRGTQRLPVLRGDRRGGTGGRLRHCGGGPERETPHDLPADEKCARKLRDMLRGAGSNHWDPMIKEVRVYT